MLPPKNHEANATELFQAVVQQNVRKWRALGKKAEKYGPATIREAQIAVFEVLGRLHFNASVNSSCAQLYVMNSFIKMQGCFSNNINRNLIQLPKNVDSRR